MIDITNHTNDGRTFTEDRTKHIGASSISIIMGISPYTSPYSYWEIMTKRKPAPDLSGQFQVQKGLRLEAPIREEFERATGRKYKDGNFYTHPVHSFIGGRDDGFCYEDKSCLEIKCMGRDNHNNVAQGIIPEHYILQTQYEMGLNGALRCHFISGYEDMKTKELFINECTVERDQKVIDTLFNAAVNFWNNHVLADVPPEFTDADTNIIMDETFAQYAESYKLLKADIKKAEDQLEEIEEKLKSFCSDRPRNVGNGLSLSKVVRVGAIDYKAIPELKDVDLTKYRKKSTEYIKISEVKE